SSRFRFRSPARMRKSCVISPATSNPSFRVFIVSDLNEILSNNRAFQYRLRAHLEKVLTPEWPESAGQETLGCFLARCSTLPASASKLSPVVINRHVGRNFSTRQSKTKQSDHWQQERQPVESL